MRKIRTTGLRQSPVVTVDESAAILEPPDLFERLLAIPKNQDSGDDDGEDGGDKAEERVADDKEGSI